MSVVIVGNGMAGARLAVELRQRDPRRPVAVLDGEPGPAYNRILLSDVLAGTVGEEDLRLPEPDGPVDRRSGVTVRGIDRANRVVIGDDGSRLRYDTLVLATGSRPVVPPVPGLAERALPFRTASDCRAILDAAERSGATVPATREAPAQEAPAQEAPAQETPAREGTPEPEVSERTAADTADVAGRCVVLGGGLLGLEAARGLARRGLRVTVVHLGPYPMDRQLDPEAGEILRQTLDDLGVRVLVRATATRVSDEGVQLEDGEFLPADLVVTACGVRPETGLASEAGLDVDHGIVVDDRMRTSDPDILAIGDCVQHRGRVYGLVAPAWEQAAVAADVICAGERTYQGSKLVTRLKAPGIDLASIGDPDGVGDPDGSGDREGAGDPDGAGEPGPPEPAEVVTFADPARRCYQKVVISEGRLVGAILLGDNPTVGTVTQLYDRDAPVPLDPRWLLFGGAGAAAGGDGDDASAGAATADAEETVCRCNGVNAGAITRAWVGGARTVEEVSAATRAGTGCGGCRDTIAGFVEHLKGAVA